MLTLDPFLPNNPTELSPKVIVPLFSPSVPAVIPAGTVPVYCPLRTAAATFVAPAAEVITDPFRYIAEFVPETSVPFVARLLIPVYSNAPPVIFPRVYVEPGATFATLKLFEIDPLEFILNKTIFCPLIFMFPVPLKLVVPSR